MRSIFTFLAILIILSISTLGFSATPLKKGDLAPYDGVIFTAQESQKLVETDKTKILLEKLTTSQNQKIELQQQRIDLLQGYVKDHQELSSYGKAGWFIIGVLSTSLILYSGASLINSTK